jgi:transmembrane sensor
VIPQAKGKIHSLLDYSIWFAAAATILAFITIGIWKYKPNTSKPSIAASSVRSITGPYYVTLPDHTIIELGKGATLSYNQASFGLQEREVRLSGTAYFDVAHNPSHPFKLRSGRVLTTVLGTAFNVSESKDFGIIEVTVVRGKVGVGDSLNTFETVLPSHKITVKTDKMTFAMRKTKGEIEMKCGKTTSYPIS